MLALSATSLRVCESDQRTADTVQAQRSPTTSGDSTGSATASASSAGPPFVVQSSFPGSALDPFAADALWEYLRPLGARIASENWETGPRMTFKMLFLSDSSTNLSIQSMQPVQIACTDSTAVTVVDFAGEGDDAVPTVTFSLLQPDAPLAGVDAVGCATAAGQSTQVVDDAGRPFVLEAVPPHPVQHIQYGLDSSGRPRWADCATVSDCS